MASKRRIRRKSCGDKVRYTKETAIPAARVLSAKKREAYHPYKCDFGNHWHVAHTRTTHGDFVVFDRRFAKV